MLWGGRTEGVEYGCDTRPRNRFSMRGAAKCIPCPEGQAPINKNGKCGTCPAGTSYDQDVFGCKTCPQGAFQPSEDIRSSCLQCSSDQNSQKGATTCTKCATGEAVMKDGTCGVCPPGMGYGSSDLKCRKCGVNKYSRGNGLDIECSSCPRFSYALLGASECTLMCPAGQVLVVKKNKGKW